MARRGAALRTGAGSGTFLLVLLVAAGGFLKDSAPVGVRAQGDGTAGAPPVYEYEDDYDPSAVPTQEPPAADPVADDMEPPPAGATSMEAEDGYASGMDASNFGTTGAGGYEPDPEDPGLAGGGASRELLEEEEPMMADEEEPPMAEEPEEAIPADEEDVPQPPEEDVPQPPEEDEPPMADEDESPEEEASEPRAKAPPPRAADRTYGNKPAEKAASTDGLSEADKPAEKAASTDGLSEADKDLLSKTFPDDPIYDGLSEEEARKAALARRAAEEAEIKAAEAADKSRRDTGAPVEKEKPKTIFDYYKPKVLDPVYVGGYYKRANPWDKGRNNPAQPNNA